jgi:hypothetical protein
VIESSFARKEKRENASRLARRILFFGRGSILTARKLQVQRLFISFLSLCKLRSAHSITGICTV